MKSRNIFSYAQLNSIMVANMRPPKYEYFSHPVQPQLLVFVWQLLVIVCQTNTSSWLPDNYCLKKLCNLLSVDNYCLKKLCQ